MGKRLSDIEIAQSVTPRPIEAVAQELGLSREADAIFFFIS